VARGAIISILAAACAVPAGAAPGREKALKLPPALAELLTRAQGDLQAGRPAEAIRRLSAHRGQDHALRHLLMGHAYVQQSKLPAAAAAYGKALEMDAALAEAGIALAQVHARQDAWAKAAGLLGRFVNADSCRADVLMLYAQVADRLEDGRLCELLVSKGICRFPGDLRFRRLDLALCIARGEHEAARRTVLMLLKAAPGEADLWQQLAFLHDQAGQGAETVAALEASVLCDPGDLARHRRFLAGLLAAGDWLTAVKHGKGLLAGPLAKAAAADGDVMESLIRAADRGQADEVLGKWLALVPEEAQTRTMRIVTARRSLRLGQAAQARQALGRLIEAGETDPSVFLWAGHLAETAKDWAEARTLYAHARALKGPAARLATLYLARLHIRRGRREEASRLLRKYLETYPEDAPARALLALADAVGRAAPGE